MRGYPRLRVASRLLLLVAQIPILASACLSVRLHQDERRHEPARDLPTRLVAVRPRGKDYDASLASYIREMLKDEPPDVVRRFWADHARRDR